MLRSLRNLVKGMNSPPESNWTTSILTTRGGKQACMPHKSWQKNGVVENEGLNLGAPRKEIEDGAGRVPEHCTF